MKRLLACAALTLLPGAAVADWDVVAEGASLTDTSGGLALQILSGEDIGLSLISGFSVKETTPLCENSIARPNEAELFDSWEINGKPVKIGRMCDGLQLVLAPYSREGQEYLASLIKSNKNITVRSRAVSQPFIFINKNGSEAILKITNGPKSI